MDAPIEKSACASAQADCGFKESAFLNCLDRALIGTSAAADANISIDDELVFALGDCLDGALVSAGTALDASISNIVSHDFTSICFVGHLQCTSILAWIFENAMPVFELSVYFFKTRGRIRQ
jgi:hypothetical protein